MPQNRITYSLVGGSDLNLATANISGSAVSRNMFTETNTDGKNDVRTYLQSCPGIKYFDSFGDTEHCDGLFVPSTGLETMDYEQCLFVAYNTTCCSSLAPSFIRRLLLCGNPEQLVRSIV